MIDNVQGERERVNALLREEAQKLDLGTSKSLARLDRARQVRRNRIVFSRWARLEFREFIRRQLELYQDVSSSDLIDNGALLLRVSPATTSRYLAALLSGGVGPFIARGRKRVVFNHDYVSPDKASPAKAHPTDKQRGAA